MANVYPAGKKRVCYYYDGTFFFPQEFSRAVKFHIQACAVNFSFSLMAFNLSWVQSFSLTLLSCIFLSLR